MYLKTRQDKNSEIMQIQCTDREKHVDKLPALRRTNKQRLFPYTVAERRGRGEVVWGVVGVTSYTPAGGRGVS
jgi:hypothetical protein